MQNLTLVLVAYFFLSGCQTEAKITPPSANSAASGATSKLRPAPKVHDPRVVETRFEIQIADAVSTVEAQQKLGLQLQAAASQQVKNFEACWGGTGKDDLIRLRGSFRLVPAGTIMRFRTLEWAMGPTRQQECLTSKIKRLDLASVVKGLTSPAKGYWEGTLTLTRGYPSTRQNPKHFEKSKDP